MDVARRFHRRALLLDAPAPDIATALAHHGYFQIDPINVCGRMHDLIARNRIANYREGDLVRHLHGSDVPLPAERRVAFEHHLPSAGTLVAFPLEAWPHLQAANLARTRRSGAWSGRLTPRQRLLAPALMEAIAARGPLNSEHFENSGRSRAVWGSATAAKSTLQKLFFHGRLLIARRDAAGRRYYDLPERVLPAAILRQPASTAADVARWEALLKLRQRRLVLLKRDELRRVEDLVQPVQIDDCPTLHILKSDVPLLDQPASAHGDAPPPLLLAPLDPLIYDRRVTSALWSFNYTWEVYTPPHKRQRGYYALPVLSGTDIVGHIDPKADRESRRLRVVNRSLRRPHRASALVKSLAQFLGLR